MTTARIPAQNLRFGDRDFCAHCELIAHHDRTLGTVHTGTLKAECEPKK